MWARVFNTVLNYIRAIYYEGEGVHICDIEKQSGTLGANLNTRAVPRRAEKKLYVPYRVNWLELSNLARGNEGGKQQQSKGTGS